MASSIQSNPVYYSLASLSSGQNPPSHTVVLHKRPDHDGFGVYIGEDIPSGLYIVTIERNSPASYANIQPGDRVLAVNGELVSKMSRNPKEMLMKAASQAESLTLTIQSNNILQTLDIPSTSTNNYKDNNDHSIKRNSSEGTSAVSLDLENYIKSLFTDENVQILQTPNNNEFIFKSNSYKPSSMPFNSGSNRYYLASGHKKERPRRRHSKRKLPETKEMQTQTSFDDDDEYPTYLSMDTSQRILRTQQQISVDNSSYKSLEFRSSLTNQNSDFTAVPPTLVHNKVTSNSAENSHPPQQQHMADIVEAVMIASRKEEKAKNREQTTSRESASATKRTTTPPRESPPGDAVSVTSITTTSSTSRDAAPATTRTTTPPPSRDAAPVIIRTTTPPPSRDAAPTTKKTTTSSTSRDTTSATTRTTTPPPSRDAAPVTKRTTTPPPSRDTVPATTKTTRDTTSATTRTTTPPPSRDTVPATTKTTRDTVPATTKTTRDTTSATTRTTTPPPPPPYSETAVAIVPVEVPNNQANGHAEANQQAAAAAAAAVVTDVSLDEGLREVHLRRSPDFQGFGFHLQYNKMYYLVQSVEAGSPAQEAGLHGNDVIHSINHQTTSNMPHGIFVETVNANSDIDLTVQTRDAYLRANPLPVRNPQTAAAVATVTNTDNEKQKSVVSKTLAKLTSR